MFESLTNGRAAETADDSRASTKGTLLQLLGALAGWFLAWYFGAGLLLIPGVVLIAVYLLARALKVASSPYVHVVALQTAHLAWFTVGAILTRQFAPVFLDLVILTALLIWLVARPAPLAAICLAGFNGLAVAVNIYPLTSAGGTMFKPLLAHLLLRAGIILCVVLAVLKSARSRSVLAVQRPESPGAA